MAGECDVPLIGVNNDPCNKLGIGKQIVALFYQDSAGTPPDLMSNTATLAIAQAAMTADGANQLFVVNNLAATEVPAASDQVLSGNDVPYGGQELTGRQRTITGRLQYLSASTITATNQINQRGGTGRYWALDEAGYLQGPYENATMVYGSMARPGAGAAGYANIPFTLAWDSIDEAPISAQKKPFLKGLVNAA